MRIAFACILAASSGFGAATHQWDTMPYTFAPLVQQGSGNLLPAMDKWSLRNAATIAQVDGKPAVRLGPIGKDGADAFNTEIDAKPDTLYELSWRCQLTPDTKLAWDQSYAGLVGWLAPRGGQLKTKGAIRLRESRTAGPWREFGAQLLTPPGTKQVTVSLAANIKSGAALVTDIVLREAKVEQAEGRQFIVAPELKWAEARRAPEPAAPSKTTVFHRADPDQLFPYSRPRPEELDPKLDLVAARGETVVTTLALYAAEPLAKLRLDASAAPMPLDWRVVRYQPRRVDYYGRGNTWHWLADVLLDEPNGLAAPAGRTQVLWLRVTVPADAKPGTTSGRIAIVANGREPITVPMSVTVQPFALAAGEDKVRGLYGDVGRWKSMTDAQVRAELRDMREHGFNDLMVPGGGHVTLEGTRATKWEFDELPVRTIPMILEAGFRGPYLMWFGHRFRDVARQLGMTDAMRNSFADKWPPELAAASTDMLRLIKADADARGWKPLAMIAVDEPGYWKKGSPERLEWHRKITQAAGWDIYCTSSQAPSDFIGKGIKFHCYGGGKGCDPRVCHELREQTHAAGQEFWYYSTGSYSGQMGRVVRNRYQSGFLFFRSRADGTYSWTFQRARGNAYDDFVAPRSGQACITYPDPRRPGDNLDTPHWEGMRQGWLDDRYCATLAHAIEQCADKAKAAAMRKRFDALLASMPWGGQVYAAPGVTNDQCDRWRRQVGAMIGGLAR